MDPAGRGDGGKIERVVLRHTRYHIKKIVSERMLCNTGSSPELLTTWRGGTWWREISEGGDVCILMTYSCCCMEETNTTL